jgi:hypothetical protein
MGVAALGGAPLVAGGTRVKRGMGVRSAHGHVKEGGLAMARARAGGPGHEHVRSGGGSPRTAAPGRTRGRQGKREKGERTGKAGRWAGPWSGSRLSTKEIERGREWQVGTGLRINVFKLVQKYSNLIRPKINLLDPQKFELKYGFEGFDERNNFLHRNFSRFEMDFKLKFRKSKV